MKVSELEGVRLDYLVAKSVYPGASFMPWNTQYWLCDPKGTAQKTNQWGAYDVLWIGYDWRPSVDWLICGPLIEKYNLMICRADDGITWDAGQPSGRVVSNGSTPQQAICRAVVASVYGDEVDD